MKQAQLTVPEHNVVTLKDLIKSIPNADKLCSWTIQERKKLEKLKALKLRPHRMTFF